MSDRTALHEAKLRALVRDAGHGEIDCIESPGDAGGFVASRGFVLVDGLEPARAVRALGPALLWATKHRFETLSILASHDVAGHVARRAGALGGGEMQARGSFGPLVDVLAVSGRQLATAAPAPIAEVPVLGPRVWAMAGVISEAGARPVDDHGRLVAEFAGLEVARVVEHGAEVVLEVGVGQADRELQQLVHGTLDPDAALRRAIAAVAVHRHGAAPPHPLNRLARERWLRSALLDRPSSIDLATLDPVPPLRPRDSLLGSQPVAAVGTDAAGRPVVVVCSVGIEVDLAAEAGDYRLRTDPDARLVVVVPPRDRYPIVERLIGLLDRAELVTLPTPWADDLPVPGR